MNSPARIIDNAFLVLGLTPRATWSEVSSRAAHLLESLRSAGVAGSVEATYGTPWGPRPLTDGAIRVARAQLRDPDVRIQHEIWWEAPGRGEASAAASAEPWPDAAMAWGWRSR